MLSQHTQTLQVPTKGREFHDITSEVAAQVKVAKISEGLTTVHLQHTSASLVIQENADPGVRRDLERFMARVCPDGDPMFEHDYEGPDDMPAHVRTALTAVNLSIPITDGQLALGTWQGIYLWEHRHAGHRRKVTVHILGE
jgi:secondary thiamine-phosphate synthase enzyme